MCSWMHWMQTWFIHSNHTVSDSHNLLQGLQLQPAVSAILLSAMLPHTSVN